MTCRNCRNYLLLSWTLFQWYIVRTCLIEVRALLQYIRNRISKRSRTPLFLSAVVYSLLFGLPGSGVAYSQRHASAFEARCLILNNWTESCAYEAVLVHDEVLQGDKYIKNLCRALVLEQQVVIVHFFDPFTNILSGNLPPIESWFWQSSHHTWSLLKRWMCRKW